jgi:hypothetical protein
MEHARRAFLHDICRMPPRAMEHRRWADWVDARGWTVFHHMVEYLNSRDADPGWLQAVAIEDFVSLLVQHGGDANEAASEQAVVARGHRPLHMLARRRQPPVNQHEEDVVRLGRALLAEGHANPRAPMRNRAGQLPLQVALEHGRLLFARLLVEHGASLQDVDAHGRSVRETCARRRPYIRQLKEWARELESARLAPPRRRRRMESDL